MNRLKWNVDRDDWKKNRRVVEDVPAWIGMDSLLSYYNECPAVFHKKVFLVLFETGGRVSEILELQPSQFKWNEEAIRVERMAVLKYRKRMRRDFLIKRDELNPLTDDLLSFVKDCETKYLFPKGERITGRIIPDEHTSRVRIYKKVREISDDLWCHWFRAMRASFNVFVRGMDAFQLADWFKWKSMDTPLHYINQTLSGMAENMGIKNIPKGTPSALEIEPTKIVPKVSKIAEPKPKKEESSIDIYALLKLAEKMKETK